MKKTLGSKIEINLNKGTLNINKFIKPITEAEKSREIAPKKAKKLSADELKKVLEISKKQMELFDHNTPIIFEIGKKTMDIINPLKKRIKDGESITIPPKPMSMKALVKPTEPLQNYEIKLSSDKNYVHVIDKYEKYVYGTFSLGNAKLQSNEEELFLIFNLPQILTCPNASSDCLQYCYNQKRTHLNNPTIVSRRKNLVLSLYPNFSEIFEEVTQFVHKRSFKGQRVNVRWHESGDFYNAEYINKCVKIMKDVKNVNFTFYTKTVAMIEKMHELEKYEYIHAMYSIDNSTKKGIVDKLEKEGTRVAIVLDDDNMFNAIVDASESQLCNMNSISYARRLEIHNRYWELKKELEEGMAKCIRLKEIKSLKNELVNHGVNCAECKKCYSKYDGNILFLIH